MSDRTVYIATDGACRGNPGPGGWGAVLRYGSHEKTLAGFEINTTNNRMELFAAIQALRALKRPCEVVLKTDSSYVREGITRWIHGWKKRNWKKADGKPVENIQLWQQLEEASQRHSIQWLWVRGHAGDEDNEKADKLATGAIDQGLTNPAKEK